MVETADQQKPGYLQLPEGSHLSVRFIVLHGTAGSCGSSSGLATLVRWRPTSACGNGGGRWRRSSPWRPPQPAVATTSSPASEAPQTQRHQEAQGQNPRTIAFLTSAVAFTARSRRSCWAGRMRRCRRTSSCRPVPRRHWQCRRSNPAPPRTPCRRCWESLPLRRARPGRCACGHFPARSSARYDASMGKTGIAWTDYSWNPTTGCHKLSEECVNCYAETVSLNKGFSKLPWTATNAAENVVEHPERLNDPRRFNMGGQYSEQQPPRYPIKIFVDSMSDLFHDQVSDAFIEQVFGVMTDLAHRHRIFQIATKRPERAAKWPGPWTPNIWMGVTCGHYKSKPRIDVLRGCAAHVKFISAEPLLTSLKPLDLTGIDWIIAGGESGTGF